MAHRLLWNTTTKLARGSGGVANRREVANDEIATPLKLHDDATPPAKSMKVKAEACSLGDRRGGR